LSDEQVYNVLNKVSVEIEARLFRRTDRVKLLEEELEKKNKELVEKRKYLKQEDMINTQLRHELKEEKAK
ncbi:hypothetical protein KI387_038699, partial [Taxus chinensis]